MTYVDIVILLVAIAGTLGLAVIFGRYMARMIVYEKRPLEKTLGRIEDGFYRIIGVDKYEQMTWKQYFLALVVTNAIAAGFLMAVLLYQNSLPLSPKPGLSFDLAFNTAASFVTNTNLQHYAGDQQLSNFSQMVGLIFMMFVAPASGIASCFAFVRAFIRKEFGLGNFYVDFTRIIITLLLPIAFFSALLLLFLGVPQTLDSTITVGNLQGGNQTITIGPVASLESIKELGSNGGGFFGANSAHPFENPSGLSNVFEIILMLVIPFSLPIAYAHLLGKGRGISILAAMLIGFGVMLIIGLTQASGPTGLETRFGNFGTTLFIETSLSTNTGAANAALSGLSPNAIIGGYLGMFVQAIPGADGTGMMTMIIFIILTLFLVGLMVGKTPEFMSMKINPRDVKLAAFVFLIHPALILIPTVVAYTSENAQAILGTPTTPATFNQVLYEYTSAAANNGSDYLGTSANTPFWNWSTAWIMLIGRYAPIGLMLAIAGSFTTRDRKAIVEPIKTSGPLFVGVLSVMVFILTALTFFPFLAMGPFSM
ncbi:MAG TPA: potassium-transporting ATPase subunit KdpA [Candidatus Nitrosotalea sp.]|nr:potassium-transporting ATPase subunit KdpA [Candidatus Nitrosotalea sp.]